jgi:hypothetical protein
VSVAIRRRRAVAVVNSKYCSIFNRVFEKQKLTRNGKKFAEMRANRTWESCVYHARIKHDCAVQQINCRLRRRSLAVTAAIVKLTMPVSSRNLWRLVSDRGFAPAKAGNPW